MPPSSPLEVDPAIKGLEAALPGGAGAGGAADASLYHDFHWVQSDEPHATRRKQILAAHPEIRQLFTREIRTLPIVLVCVLAQWYISYALRDSSWWLILALAYVVGGTINHSMQLANHELSHNLCFATPLYNNLLGIFSNLCTGVPSSQPFFKYHLEHHQYQGYDGFDVDLPTPTEVNLVKSSALLKALYIICMPAVYSIRPLLVRPKVPNWLDILNTVSVIGFDLLWLYLFGVRAFGYLLLGSLLGTGLHPVAGHFLAEHLELVRGTETYSYYGILNYVNFNVGYHNEHHDFPRVPWSNLPKVREMAPEFYRDLPYHTSYLRVFYEFIFDPNVGPWSRVKRRRNM